MGGDDEKTDSLIEATGTHDVEVPAPHLVVVADSERPLLSPARVALAGLDELSIGRGAVRRKTPRGPGSATLEIPDGWMSSEHLTLRRRDDAWTLEDRGSKNGTAVNGVRLDSHSLCDGDLIEAGTTFVLFRLATADLGQLAGLDAEVPEGLHPALATLSLELEHRLTQLRAATASDVPALLVGETGTGKELAAQAIHDHSSRSGPLQAVNCGALPRELVQSELFGSRRGAFSGAVDRLGHVRAAHGGTLFLDEIAELPEPAQVALLRVLQEREVTPLGDSRAVPVDLRVVAASQRPLAEAVAEGRFRADLYARLAGLEIELLPLRRRREDTGLIVASLLHDLAGSRALEVRFRKRAMRALLTYDWPYNVRELRQALAAAMACAPDRPIAVTDLPQPIQERAAPRNLSESDRAIRDALVEALVSTRGNISATARRLGRARVQIRRWCARFGVDPQRFRM